MITSIIETLIAAAACELWISEHRWRRVALGADGYFALALVVSKSQGG